MPIYPYRCSSCGHQQDFLRKVSDPPLTVCPQCSKDTFSKMLTAAGFQLKGSGWYVTDFRGNGASGSADGKAGSESADKAEAKPADAKGDAASTPAAPAASPSTDASAP